MKSALNDNNEYEGSPASMMENTRGLNYDENLLWEKGQGDHSGVDLPAPKGTALRTGQKRLQELARRHGRELLSAGMAAIQDYA